MANLNDYQQGTADWRKTIQENATRTRLVMITYVLIYLCLGLLIDVFYRSGHYPDASLGEIFRALITFQITPYATIITIAVAIISLWVTFTYADKLMLLGTEYREITAENAANLEEKQFYNVVEEMKVAAGMKFMPKVYIIEADYMNAFASGWSEKSAMVAITRGLMQKLDRAEMQAVMAHELTHIRHQDIKLTLVASVLSNLILIIIDILFYSVIFGGGRSGGGDRDRGNQLFVIILIIRYLMPIVTVLLMLYLSRKREFMADAGAVELMRDNQPMARALLKISQDHQEHKEEYNQDYRSTGHEQVRRQAYIYDPVESGIEPVKSLADSFSTHPSIKARLKALGFTK